MVTLAQSTSAMTSVRSWEQASDSGSFGTTSKSSGALTPGVSSDLPESLSQPRRGDPVEEAPPGLQGGLGRLQHLVFVLRAEIGHDPPLGIRVLHVQGGVRLEEP